MLFALPTNLAGSSHHQKPPIANSAVIAVTVLLFWFSGFLAISPGSGFLSPLTYVFAHTSLLHLLLNMWVLWVFGNPVNRRLGNGIYLLAYFGSALAIGILARLCVGVPLMGASGAIFSIIAIGLLLMPAAKIDVAYLAIFPLTVLVGLFSRPKHWLNWVIRWGQSSFKAYWGVLMVPAMELVGLLLSGWNWTNLGHLLGLLCGLVIVLLLPSRISMPGRPVASGG